MKGIPVIVKWDETLGYSETNTNYRKYDELMLIIVREYLPTSNLFIYGHIQPVSLMQGFF